MNFNFIEEQKKLLYSFLDIHCFRNWRIPPSKRTGEEYVNLLEMMVSPVCNTACTYCYMKNYADSLYPCFYDKNSLLNNCKKIMTWLKKENFYPSSIEIFSGEFFNLPFWKDYLQIIYDSLEKMEEGKKVPIVIPTNGTFFDSEKKTQEIQDYFDRVYKKGFIIVLSLSVDGYYLDNDTRPFRDKRRYTEDFYDRMFRFGARNLIKYHPMIGAKGIERWVDNFDWYVENIQKYYKIPKKEALEKLYLLEVRNPDWSTKELKDFKVFLNHIIDVLFEGCTSPEEKFNLLLSNTLNILAPLVVTIGRGLPCSFQQCLDLRVGDLALVQCHRTAYSELLGGYFKISDKGELDLDVRNANSYIFSNSFNFKHLAKCIDCPISSLCNGPCLGCNYEVNRDLYTVVPTVCDLEYTKALTLVERAYQEGFLDSILEIHSNSTSSDSVLKKNQLLHLKKYLEIKNTKGDF